MARRSILSLLAGGTAAAADYTLQKEFVGEDFFGSDKWKWFTQPDPTKGAVDYVDQQTAESLNMVKADSDRVYIGAGLSAVSPGTNIPSVRLQSTDTFNSGLIILSLDHQPTGCGVWPAFWMTGDDPQHPWPVWGEADFLEGSHGQNQVWTTLHTLQNCDQSALKSGVDFSGTWMGALDPDVPSTNCSIVATDQGRNEGCPIVGPEGTMGPKFNAAGGGTFAFEWDPEAGYIRGFFWPVGEEPADIGARAPNPDSWGLPYSRFNLGPACPQSRFKNMRIVLNTDFCGEWGNLDVTFHEKCPWVPADMSCNQWVSTYPGNLTEAYWSITRMDLYQKSAFEEIVV